MKKVSINGTNPSTYLQLLKQNHIRSIPVYWIICLIKLRFTAKRQEIHLFARRIVYGKDRGDNNLIHNCSKSGVLVMKYYEHV